MSAPPVVEFVCFGCGNGPPGLVESEYVPGRVEHDFDGPGCPPLPEGMEKCDQCYGAFPTEKMVDGVWVEVHKLDVNRPGATTYLHSRGFRTIKQWDRQPYEEWGQPGHDLTVERRVRERAVAGPLEGFGEGTYRLCADEQGCRKREDDYHRLDREAAGRGGGDKDNEAGAEPTVESLPQDGGWRTIDEMARLTGEGVRSGRALIRQWAREGALEVEERPTGAGGSPKKLYRRPVE